MTTWNGMAVITASELASTSALSLEGLYGRPGFKIRRAHQTAVAIFAEATAGLNITTSQYGVLHTLGVIKELDQVTLARLVGLDRSTTSLVLGHLEERGLVQRVQNTVDRRRRILDITSTGRELLELSKKPVAFAVSRLMESLGTAERDRLLDILEGVVNAATPSVEPAMARLLRDLYRRPGFLIRRVHQVTSALFIEACKPNDVTPTQFGMMFVLNQRPHLDQVTLAGLAYFDRSTNSMVAEILVNRGWIERKIDVLDRRRRLLSLTPLGEHSLGEIMRGAQKARDSFFASIDPNDRDFLLSSLDAITASRPAS